MRNRSCPVFVAIWGLEQPGAIGEAIWGGKGCPWSWPLASALVAQGLPAGCQTPVPSAPPQQPESPGEAVRTFAHGRLVPCRF